MIVSKFVRWTLILEISISVITEANAFVNHQQEMYRAAAKSKKQKSKFFIPFSLIK